MWQNGTIMPVKYFYHAGVMLHAPPMCQPLLRKLPSKLKLRMPGGINQSNQAKLSYGTGLTLRRDTIKRLFSS